MLHQLQRVVITPSQLTLPILTLTPEQQHYLNRVLRLRAGDRFIAMDGRGKWWLVTLEEAADQARILEEIPIATELSIHLTLLVALPKGSGMDDVVRQVTELGAGEIVPVISDRTLLNPSPQKLERWRRIAQEAAEQSERQYVPAIADPLPWSAVLETWNTSNARCLICTARGNPPHLMQQLTVEPIDPLRPLVVATGPEGGWTAREVERAIAAGYRSVSLGKRILRAVTAPGAAVAIIGAMAEKA
jgi:16S rRNA (uracil1498-N3)-methyltransferase